MSSAYKIDSQAVRSRAPLANSLHRKENLRQTQEYNEEQPYSNRVKELNEDLV